MLHPKACAILFPQPGFKCVPPAVAMQSVNKLEARDVPNKDFFKKGYNKKYDHVKQNPEKHVLRSLKT